LINLWRKCVVFGVLAWLACLTPCPVDAAAPDPVRFGVAIELGDVRSAETWLDEGLPPDFMADRIGSGLMIAAWEGNIEMMELFLSRGANINLVNAHDEQALQLAAWRGKLDAVNWLLEHGASVSRTGNKWSALHYATFAGQKEIVQLLLRRGAEVNARAPNKSSVLMMAAREGHEDLARLLLEAGADLKAANDWGDSALTWAMRYNNLSIAKLVSNPEEFTLAAKAPPGTYGKPIRSVSSPSEIEIILRQIRLAEAAGRPVGHLRKALFDAVARFKKESQTITAKGKPGRNKRPKALLITAKRQGAGERAVLVYDQRQEKAQEKKSISEVSAILEQISQARAAGRPVDDLRKALFEAVASFKKEDGAK